MGWGAVFIVISQGPRPVEEMPLETLPVARPERKEVLERSHTDFYLFSPEVTPPNHWPVVLPMVLPMARVGRTCNPTVCPEKGNNKYLFTTPHFCSLQFLDVSPCLGDSNLFINQKNMFSLFHGAHPSSV